MPWKHVFSPAAGMVTNRPATGIAPEASPFLQGVIIHDGEVWSDYGTVPYPIPSPTQSNQLSGSVMKIIQFPLNDGVIYEICLTTTNIYVFNTVTNTWDVITQSIIVDPCTDTWTSADANVTTSNSTVITIRGGSAAVITFAPAPVGLMDDSGDTIKDDSGNVVKG